MDLGAFLIVSLNGLFWIGCMIILVYLVHRRIQIKKTEDFEDRDN